MRGSSAEIPSCYKKAVVLLATVTVVRASLRVRIKIRVEVGVLFSKLCK